MSSQLRVLITGGTRLERMALASEIRSDLESNDIAVEAEDTTWESDEHEGEMAKLAKKSKSTPVFITSRGSP